MRMRSALTTSVLAVGILLGSAGAALANDGDGLVQATASSSFAGVTDHVGPVWANNSQSETEVDGAEIQEAFGR